MMPLRCVRTMPWAAHPSRSPLTLQPKAARDQRFSRTGTDLEAGVPAPAATADSGTSGLVSG